MFFFSFGLSWNIKDKGKLLSGSYDGLVCLWDVNKNPTTDNNVRYITATHTFRGHEDVVEDVDWHPEQRNVFASVGDDKVSNIQLLKFRFSASKVLLGLVLNASPSFQQRLILWDTRVGSDNPVHVCEDAHRLDINAVSFSPFFETCFATGSSDSVSA